MEIIVEGIRLEQVNGLKYLESTIRFDESCTKEIKSRICSYKIVVIGVQNLLIQVVYE